MNFICDICNMTYKTRNGLYKHNKNYHSKKPEENNIINKYICNYCNKQLNSRQSKWMHEQKCKEINNKPLEERIQELSNKIKKLESKPNNTTNNSNNNNSNNNSNNTTNIQYVINSPAMSSIDHLTFETQQEILDKGLNSLMYLIELINFNKLVPENHSYCITAINDKHASVIDEKTNKVIKTNKFDLFDKILGINLNNLEKLSDNPNLSNDEKNKYKNKIQYLRDNIFQNNKFMKRYLSDINLISYNNKEMIQDTWKSLRELTEDEETEEEEYYGDKPRGFDDLIDALPEDQKPDFLKTENKLIESSSDEESSNDEIVEIKIKGIMYILEDKYIYNKNSKGTKGQLYGTYNNGKIKKLNSILHD